ncbi:MAG: nucleotidyltransferase domain-containing protein [archaeon]|nr:nucleotidyltransferase domain-containing protein [archaeon]
MIHNKYSEILNIFTGDYRKEIYGRELIGKVSISQKGIALTLKELEEEGILKSKKKGSIRFYSLNLKYSQIKEIIAIAELDKKTQFYQKHRAISHIFKDDERIVVLFGSYAKGTQKKESDLDIFIIGKKKAEDYDKKGEEFDLEINIKYFTEKEFKELLNKKNSLINEIIKNHIIFFNTEKFISMIWKEYYGLN